MKYYNFPQRLEREMSDWGISQTAMAIRLGKTQAAISRWLKGEVSPRAQAAKNLADMLGVRVEWLLRGEGEKLPEGMAEQVVKSLPIPPSHPPTESTDEDDEDSDTSVPANDHIAELRATAARLSQMADELERNRLFLPEQIAGNQRKLTPKAKRASLRDIASVSLAIYGSLPAGWPDRHDGANAQQPVRIIKVPRGTWPEGAFGLDVRGDSMNAAKPEPILDGDTVILVSPEQREPKSGDIVAALLDGGTCLKRLVNGDQPAHLKSESSNPAYGTLHPAHELIIQGVVVGKL